MRVKDKSAVEASLRAAAGFDKLKIKVTMKSWLFLRVKKSNMVFNLAYSSL